MSTFRKFELSDGITHEKYLRKGWFIIIPLGVSFLFLGKLNILYPIFLCINFLICEFLSPDADQLGLVKEEGDILRTFRRFYLGPLGAVIVGYWTVYAEICLYFGGHRSWFSHGWVVGTFGRMVWFNLPLVMGFYQFYLKGVAEWGWHSFGVIGWNYFYMDIWLIPYLITQLCAWEIGDSIHLILDTDWFKRLNNK